MTSHVDEQAPPQQADAHRVEIPPLWVDRAQRVWTAVRRAPFTRRTWAELLFFCLSGLVAGVAFVVVSATFVLGIALVVTFVGVIILAASVRQARGLGTWQRRLARSLLDEAVADPDPFEHRPGFFGWLQAALRDTTGWRAMAYAALKVPLVVFGVWFALSVWIDTFLCLTYVVWGRTSSHPRQIGIVYNVFPPGYLSVGTNGFLHDVAILVTGVILLFVAPWPMRGVVWLDRRLVRALLGPDAVTARVRSLEAARSRTVEHSAATLRRIERDLHDGTQAQLVALAMRLGQAKEELARGGTADLAVARRLVDEAHQGVKEAIVELREVVRGIHPPALDTGLESALATLAARSSLPAQLAVSLRDRPTPAIEAIAYFCVAELLANAAQHAHASQVFVNCTQYGDWIRVVVRDDGRGGAQPSNGWSRSSGLSGLAERVRSVDGRFDISSPLGGPTAVTVDLPLHA